MTEDTKTEDTKTGKKIKVTCTNIPNVHLGNGEVLKYGEVAELDEEIAEILLKAECVTKGKVKLRPLVPEKAPGKSE